MHRGMTRSMASRPLRVAGWIVGKLLYAAWVALMIATPLFGFWLASLARRVRQRVAVAGARHRAVAVSAAAARLGAVFVWRRRRRGEARKPILTRLDRLVLRTLIINGLFLGIMMWRAPHTAFRALAVRGDWILDGHDGPIAQHARDAVARLRGSVRAAAGTRDDTTYGTSDKPPPPTDARRRDLRPNAGDPDMACRSSRKIRMAGRCPRSPTPLVTSMPDGRPDDVEAVAQYFATRITDQHRLAKALHDYVVLRLTYDTPTSQLQGRGLATSGRRKKPTPCSRRRPACARATRGSTRRSARPPGSRSRSSPATSATAQRRADRGRGHRRARSSKRSKASCTRGTR